MVSGKLIPSGRMRWMISELLPAQEVVVVDHAVLFAIANVWDPMEEATLVLEVAKRSKLYPVIHRFAQQMVFMDHGRNCRLVNHVA